VDLLVTIHTATVTAYRRVDKYCNLGQIETKFML
jgi:hypothetical protein